MIYNTLYDRYLAKSLLHQFLVWSAFFAILFTLSVFLEKLDILLNHDAGAGSVLAYLGRQLPFWIWRGAPIAFLGASLTVLDDAHRSGEFVALESLGISTLRLQGPILGFAAALTLAGSLGIDSYAPIFYRQARTYLKTDIQKKAKLGGPLRNFVAKGRESRYFTFGLLDPAGVRFENLWIDEWRDGRHIGEIFAKRGHHDEKRGLWILETAAKRSYPSGGEETEVSTQLLDHLTLELKETPKNLLPSSWRPEEMTLSELNENLKILKDRGMAHRSLAAEYHSRLTASIAFIIMALTATTVLTALPRKIFKGKLVLFGITIVVGLVYWFMVSLTKTLATHGLIRPDLASWGPHLIFVALMQLARVWKPF
ncbi:MAG: LptF/LptG family permease [Elusimicrobia bacterium]|nr:LptF/LptG family permease [Elusimicrobiota bacterium]